MGLLDIILSALVALFAGLNIFQIFSFRAYKKKYQAQAEMEEAVAYSEKQTALEKRLESVERLYDEQGRLLDKLREEQLKLSQEKYEKQQLIVKLEGEISLLNEKLCNMSRQLDAYKTIAESK